MQMPIQAQENKPQYCKCGIRQRLRIALWSSDQEISAKVCAGYDAFGINR